MLKGLKNIFENLSNLDFLDIISMIGKNEINKKLYSLKIFAKN